MKHVQGEEVTWDTLIECMEIAAGGLQTATSAKGLSDSLPKAEIDKKLKDTFVYIMTDNSGKISFGNGSGTNTKPLQEHHYATNKSKKYTSQFENIANKYGLDLDDPWNKEFLPHQGRHSYDYHEFVLDEMIEIDKVANGNKDLFIELYEENVKSVIRENPEMLYKEYWLNN